MVCQLQDAVLKGVSSPESAQLCAVPSWLRDQKFCRKFRTQMVWYRCAICGRAPPNRAGSKTPCWEGEVSLNVAENDFWKCREIVFISFNERYIKHWGHFVVFSIILNDEFRGFGISIFTLVHFTHVKVPLSNRLEHSSSDWAFARWLFACRPSLGNSSAAACLL